MVFIPTNKGPIPVKLAFNPIVEGIALQIIIIQSQLSEPKLCIGNRSLPDSIPISCHVLSRSLLGP